MDFLDENETKCLINKGWHYFAIKNSMGVVYYLWDYDSNCLLKIDKDFIKNILKTDIKDLSQLKTAG